MDNKDTFEEWKRFAEMDIEAAEHLFNTMYPKPLEIICYHCQQSVEKLLKAILILHNDEIQRTHDLGLLAELCENHINLTEEQYNICDNLTPYGVKIRYPQELFLEERHAQDAIKEARTFFDQIVAKIK